MGPGTCRKVLMDMAKKVTVSFVDDLDGRTAADETVAFTLDEVTYEIDLATKNAKKRARRFSPGSAPDGASGDGAEARSWARAGQRQSHESPQRSACGPVSTVMR
jgi:hypothetical protein